MVYLSGIEGSCSCVQIRLARLIIFMILSFGISGCGSHLIKIDTMHNKPYDPKEKITKASEKITYNDLTNGVFIGIALSGGGSRAANFSSAVLLELKKLGILDNATAISSVSGSSLPAAYYGLFPTDWNDPNKIRKKMAKNFQDAWILRCLIPWKAILYWNSNYNRSDIMKEVLDSNLFYKKTFADMGNGQPRILINSTTISGLTPSEHFVFSKERFNNILGSQIETYPVANAVMASSACPGVFQNMTVIDYVGSAMEHERKYEHLLDGGPSDNLGVTTLLDIIWKLYHDPESKPPKGCFIIIVDAYCNPINPKGLDEADTRNFFSYFIDTNALDASDSLFKARRLDLLNRFNIDSTNYFDEPFKENVDPFKCGLEPFKSDGKEVKCAVWHLSLGNVYHSDLVNAKIVNSISTRYKLTGKDPDSNLELSADVLQDYLFKAADFLVNYDRDFNDEFLPDKLIRDKVLRWFQDHGLSDIIKCNSKPVQNNK